MKERLALVGLVVLGWVLIFSAAAQHSWALYGIFVAIGAVYTVVIEGPRFLAIIFHPAILWLLTASITAVFCWQDPLRHQRLVDLLSMQRGPTFEE
jgi:hypothetical protein